MIQSVESGYQIFGRMRRKKIIEGLLNSWIATTEKYCDDFEGQDAPYIYTERTHIGVLAAAAWCAGMLALEEFQHRKRTREKWTGRADLYISHESDEFYIEAKAQTRSLVARTNLSDAYESLLAEAIMDAKALKREIPGGIQLAAVFTTMTFPKSQRKSVDELLNKALNDMKETRPHALAWAFPKIMRNAKTEDKYLYPGVFLSLVDIEKL